MFAKTPRIHWLKIKENIRMYITEVKEEIYHATYTTTYRKPKTIVCQNNLSNIAVLKMTRMKYK